MKKYVKVLALFLCALMLLPMIAACDGKGGGPNDTTNTEPPEVLTEEQSFWRSVLADPASYQIIRATDAGAYDSRMALVLQSGIQTMSGAQIRVYEDTVTEVKDKEIILGATTRAGSAYQSSVDASALASDEYVIEYFGTKVVIHYNDFEGLVEAVKEIFGYLAEPSGKDAKGLFDTMISKVEVYPGNVSINSTYADGMIFQQNKTVVLKGKGLEGFTVTARLLRADGTEASKNSATIGANGEWTIQLDGQKGSYDSYKISFSVSGIDIVSLKDIVFGEVWLATGQSNMAYTLAKDIEFDSLTFDDPYLRVMKIGNYNGGYAPEALAPGENTKIQWYNGTDESSMSSMSAVAYYYASVLRQEVDMPVGIIQYAVGGTPIRSWLSRDTIQADEALLTYYRSKGYYVEAESWDTAGYRQASALYNTMVTQAADLSIAGVIWYQGEQDAGEDAGEDNKGVASTYLTELEYFYNQFCEMYGFAEYDMPFIYSLMVPYRTASQPTYFGEFTAAFATFAQTHEKASAIANYDQDPYFNDDNNASHPNTKRLVGERMATAALASTYGATHPSSSPYPMSWRVENGAMILTFDNVADGLMIHNGIGDDPYLRGFTVCGADGIYVMANAEIISANEVKVWSDLVSAPVSVTYGFELLQRTCNLGCGRDGAVMYMAVPFCVNAPENAIHTSYYLWATCDFETQWRMSHSSKHHGYDFDVWTDCTPSSSGADIEISYDKTNKYSGTSALRVDYTGTGSFGVAPIYSGIGYDGTTTNFNDSFSTYSQFNKLTFYVRNDGTSNVKFDGVRFKLMSAALAEDSDCANGVIPADGQWHRISIDLNKLSDFVGNEFDKSELVSVTKIQFMFSGTESGTVLLDQFEWIP